jgi:hypothetical protein
MKLIHINGANVLEKFHSVAITKPYKACQSHGMKLLQDISSIDVDELHKVSIV